MKRLFILMALALLILIQGCASTNQLKKEERVKLVLHNGDTIKCYVTHIGRQQLFFKALNSQIAYRYGDIMSIGDIKAILLSNGSELSVAEFINYRKTLKQARQEEAKLAPSELHDPQYKKLKNKDIGKMNDKEFRYFLVMKEREDMLRLRKMDEEREARRQAELEALHEKLDEMKTTKATPPPPVVAGVIKPVSGGASQPPAAIGQPISPIRIADDSEIAQLLLDTGVAGALLNRAEEMQQQGAVFSPQQAQLLDKLKISPEWDRRKEEFQLWTHRAEQALKQAFLNQPDELKTKCNLSFDPNQPMDLKAMVQQIYNSYGAKLDSGSYQILGDVLGEMGATALKNILLNYPEWQFVVGSKL
ncbi:hypothetical protein JXJ21_18305 [candidate division KSB1 bacterium]|nr:hypothetical protein [candidate division KSB1 bacterium]